MAFDGITSLLKIVEQHLLEPKLFSVVGDGEMIVSLFEMIMLLSDKLRFQQAFLEEYKTKTNDPEAKNSLDKRIHYLAAKVRHKIKSKLKLVYLAGNRRKDVVYPCHELYWALRGVVKDVEHVEEMISKYSASVVGSSTNDFKKGNIMVRGTSQNALELENVVIVGFDRDVKRIIFRLLESNFTLLRNRNIDKFLKSIENPRLKLEVTPLVGEGGIGKTTLAKRVYGDPITIASFHIRAWVVVSQVHNLKEMLIGLLRCISPITSEIYNIDDAQIAEQLCRSLMGQKYLIFLDDIWTTTAWDAIQGCFPDNSNGSRILVTTRFTEVAEYLSVDPYYMKYQTLKDRWELFSRKVFEQDEYVPREYELIGKRIVLGCGGLPLAIVVIAGLLATAKESLEIWIDVAETLDGIDRYDNNNGISKVLSLSYNYLPSHLKTCFHYFGVFPEDSDIPVKKLINLWVAEGFLKPHKNVSLEEVAESYMHDLINRSLVQINELSIDGKIKSCKIHDRVHKVCVREAKKENILCIINDNHAPEASCWLSCQTSHWPITQASYGNCTPHKIRSILCFGKDVYLSKCRLVYPCLKMLRLLDLSLIKYSQGMPSGIADLIHLRYLALSTIGSLYNIRFFKLQNLLTLIVTSWMEICCLKLPCDILGLPQLRHLRVDKRCSQYLPCLVQENLQTLYWLKVASSDQKPNFRVVPNLKELGIYIEGELVPSCLESLIHLHQLEKLKFEIGRVECFYLPTDFPPNLKKLTLSYTYLPWKEMDIIGKLPHLQVLKLKDFAFCGSEWEPLEWGFRRLKVLLISRSNLKHWNASADHFPILERLVLRYCWELKRVPFDFANIGTLKFIVLESCYSSLVISANKIEVKHRNMEDRKLHVLDLGTKVGLPNNEGSEEESAELPNNERSEEESVELPNNERSDEESVELPHIEWSEEETVELLNSEFSEAESVELLNNEWSEEESVELLNNELSEAESVKLPNNESCEELNFEFSSFISHEEERPKALKKKVLKTLKNNVFIFFIFYFFYFILFFKT